MPYAFPPELQQIVHHELARGNYASEDDMLLEAVRLLHRRDEHLREFKAKLRGRLDQLDHGDVIELEDEAALRLFFDDVQMRGQQRFEASQAAS